MSSKMPRKMRKALNKLLESGELVAIEEIDSKTGKVRLRYFHPDFAPRPN
jgi:hypothetical protein